MPRFKSSADLLAGVHVDFNENFIENAVNKTPPSLPWNGDRPITFNDVDVWEFISESSGPIGIYAAWNPYAEFYVVTFGKEVIAEFSGWNANKRLEDFLVANNIPYPKGPDFDVPEYEQRLVVIG